MPREEMADEGYAANLDLVPDSDKLSIRELLAFFFQVQSFNQEPAGKRQWHKLALRSPVVRSKLLT
jgi:hypothetical protein